MRLERDIDNIQQGLLSSSKGQPHPLLLRPSTVREVLQQFSQSERYEKSFFNLDEIHKLYSMVKTKVYYHQELITIVNIVRIPTQDTGKETLWNNCGIIVEY